jgi:hypothetical protein
MFKYPVACVVCLDGPGHLVSHLLGIQCFEVAQKITLFGKMALDGRYMGVTSIIMTTLDEDETFSLARYFPQVDGYILRILEEEIHEITSYQFLLLVMIWNTLGSAILLGEMAAIIVGIRKALQRPYDSRSTVILAPLSSKMLHLTEASCARGYGTFAEREVIKEEAIVTRNIMLTHLAVRSIFGQHNSKHIACARAAGDGQAAVGWLAPYDG